MATNEGPVPPPDRWLWTSIWTSVGTAAVCAAALWLPLGTAWFPIGAGLAAFVFMYFRNPKFWFRRLTGSVLYVATLATLARGFDVAASWGEDTFGRIVVSAGWPAVVMPWLAFMVLVVVEASRSLLTRRHVSETRAVSAGGGSQTQTAVGSITGRHVNVTIEQRMDAPAIEREEFSEGSDRGVWQEQRWRGDGSASRQRELRIIAVPPESLDEMLCVSGRLTVIRNRYEPRSEEHVGGVEGARSRVYVGPADCGKTRSAAEWVRGLTGDQQSQWTVLRTDIGSIPDNEESIVLDTSLYRNKGLAVPPKAVLFLDDLATNFPAGDMEFGPTDAVQLLFKWFGAMQNFRERCVVGTISNEDMHGRPEWPDVLASLGHELKLVRLGPLDDAQYRRLWEGMDSGAISPSVTDGIRNFQLEMAEGFVNAVSEKNANPEAVAIYIQQAALKDKESLVAADAESFSDSALATWVRETWPVIRDTYGIAAKVFYGLARFLEAGRRPRSGFRSSITPSWEYHSVFGPELCESNGSSAGDYLSVIDNLRRDGHAVGKAGRHIRPIHDFILQSETLPNVEATLPDFGWFVERAVDLSDASRQALAIHFASSSVDLPESMMEKDAAWNEAWGISKGILADAESDPSRRVALLDEAIAALRDAVEVQSEDARMWHYLGVAQARKADEESGRREQATLRQEAIESYRRGLQAGPQHAETFNSLGVEMARTADAEPDTAVKTSLYRDAVKSFRQAVLADPLSAIAWSNLGMALREIGDAESDNGTKTSLYEEAIESCRQALEADAQHAEGWNNLGVALGRRADTETDAARQAELREEAIESYRQTVRINSRHAKAWVNLGKTLALEGEDKTDVESRTSLLEEAIEAYGQALEADPQNADAWNNLGVALERKMGGDTDSTEETKVSEEAIRAYRQSLEVDPHYAEALINLGTALLKKVENETDAARQAELRDEAIGKYRKAAKAAPQSAKAWYDLGVALGRKADCESETAKQKTLRDEEIGVYRRAVEADRQYVTAWNNLGAALWRKAGFETDAARQAVLRDKASAAWREAVEVGPQHAAAWRNLGLIALLKARGEADGAPRPEFYTEAIDCFREAVEADPQHAGAWENLGLIALLKARGEADGAPRPEFYTEAIECLREAVQMEPQNAHAWSNLGVALTGKRKDASEPTVQEALSDEVLASYRKAVEVNPQEEMAWSNLAAELLRRFHLPGEGEWLEEAYEAGLKAAELGAGRYNLVCALVLRGQVEEGLRELAGCLERGEVSKEDVRGDEDWRGLRHDPRFKGLVE